MNNLYMCKKFKNLSITLNNELKLITDIGLANSLSV